MAKRAYIGLGSNIGDRLAALQRAVEQLMPEAFPTRLSGVYESEPWGFASEHLFLNAVCEVETELRPRELLTALHKIEYFLGREERNTGRAAGVTGAAGDVGAGRAAGATGRSDPDAEYHDRVIDLDLLWYEDFEFKSGSFEVPHPFACIRAFVLIPWAELDPDIRLRGVRIAHWLESLPPDELAHTWARPDLQLKLPALNDLLGGLKVT
jgi:2-amino-4-hydroxy-6-hydroxymethyldihydropteridine diphosphokinase